MTYPSSEEAPFKLNEFIMRNRSWQKGGKIGINADGMYDLTYKLYNYDVSNIIPKIMFLTKQ